MICLYVAGFSFDLSTLASDTFYKVNHDGQDYFINVCKMVKGSPCDAVDKAVGICQANEEHGT